VVDPARRSQADTGGTAASDGCFVAGTLVRTPEGLHPIELLPIGAHVLAGEPDSTGTSPQAILRTFIHTVPVVLDLRVGSTIVTCSPAHPFWVAGRGWVSAGELSVHDVLSTASGAQLAIDGIASRTGSFTVHNISVEGLATYYVSPLEIFVHNKPANNGWGDEGTSDTAPRAAEAAPTNAQQDAAGEYARRVAAHKAAVKANREAKEAKREAREKLEQEAAERAAKSALVVPDTAEKLRNGVSELQGKWSELDRKGREDEMTKLINDLLQEFGIPSVTVVSHKLDANTLGKFDHREWKILLREDMLNNTELDDKTTKELAVRLAHEARHAEQYFQAARGAAMDFRSGALPGGEDGFFTFMGEKGFRQGEAEAAWNEPLLDVEKHNAATAMFNTMFGKKRARAHDELRTANEEYAETKKAVSDAAKPTPERLIDANSDAARRVTAAQDAYEHLLEELDARKVGEAVAKPYPKETNQEAADRPANGAAENERASDRDYSADNDSGAPQPDAAGGGGGRPPHVNDPLTGGTEEPDGNNPADDAATPVAGPTPDGPTTGQTPGTGASSAVPNSSYGNTANPNRTAVQDGVTSALPRLASHADPRTGTVRANSDGSLDITVDGNTRNVRIEVVPADRMLAPSDVANFDVTTDPMTIRVADGVDPHHVERALAHEVAEISSIMRHESPDTDGARADGLSHDDAGRVAELRVLLVDPDPRRAQELDALLAHMDVLGDDPTTVRRRQAIEAELGHPLPVTPEQRRAFDDARRVYNALANDPDQGRDAARAAWAARLSEDGIDVDGRRDRSRDDLSARDADPGAARGQADAQHELPASSVLPDEPAAQRPYTAADGDDSVSPADRDPADEVGEARDRTRDGAPDRIDRVVATLPADQRAYYEQILAESPTPNARATRKKALKAAKMSLPLSDDDRRMLVEAQELLAEKQLTPIDDGTNPNLVQEMITFDGTWNSRDDMTTPATNPELLNGMFDGDGDYQIGVGTTPRTKHFGGATGAGIRLRIKHAYENLVERINQRKRENPDAEVVLTVTGFSRGSAAARAFVNDLNRRGVPDRSSADGRNFEAPRIGAMVLFDTVGSVGVAGTNWNPGLDLSIPANAENVLHLTARDEHRAGWPLSSVRDPRSPDDPRITEIELPGSHSDVGGGKTPSPYPQIPLHMAQDYLNRLGIHVPSVDPAQVIDPHDPALRLHERGGLRRKGNRAVYSSRNPTPTDGGGTDGGGTDGGGTGGTGGTGGDVPREDT